MSELFAASSLDSTPLTRLSIFLPTPTSVCPFSLASFRKLPKYVLNEDVIMYVSVILRSYAKPAVDCGNAFVFVLKL